MNEVAGLQPYVRACVVALGLSIAASAALAAAVWIWIRAFAPSATTRHALWWIALAASALFPAVCFLTSLTRIEHRSAAQATNRLHATTDARQAHVRSYAFRSKRARSVSLPASILGGTPVRGSQHVRPLDLVLQSTSQHGGTAQNRLGRTIASLAEALSRPSLEFAFVISWFGLTLVQAAALARRLAALRTLKADAPMLDETVARRLRRWRQRGRTARSVALRVSAAVDVPVAVGFRKPAILLPVRVAAHASAIDLDQIALHEQAHLNRYDDWTNLLERAIACVLWFNPTVWFLLRRISLEREIACDDSVVAQTGRARRYATCLWELVRTSRLPAAAILAPGALFTSRQITTRIERLLDSRRNALPRLSPPGVAFIATIGIGVAILQIQRAPAIAVTDPQPRQAFSAGASPLHAAAHQFAQVASTQLPTSSLASPSPSPSDLSLHATVPAASSPSHSSSPSATSAPSSVPWVTSSRSSRPPVHPPRRQNRTAALAAAIKHEVRMQVAQTVEDALPHAVGVVSGNGSRSGSDGTGVSRELPSFDRIVFETGIRVEVRRSTRSRIDFGGAFAEERHTTTDVDGGTLTIGGSGSWSDDEPNALITIKTPSLDGIEVDGSSSVSVDDINTEDLALTMSGSGTISVAGGFARRAAVADEGSGDVDIVHLRTDTLNVSVEGSGSVMLTAPRTLALAIDGSGDIEVHGHAQSLASQVNGSGHVMQE